MKKYYQTLDFKNLEKTWNKKLVKSGFIDAERTTRSDRVLKKVSSNSHRYAKSLNKDYFQIISDNILSTEFKNETDQKIMILFADGKNRSEIAKKIKKKGKRFRETVGLIIRRYEHIWGIKYWTSKERGLKNG